MAEALFQAVSAKNWAAALGEVHALRSESGEVADRARGVLADAIGAQLASDPAAIEDHELEKLFLLAKAGWLRLPEALLDSAAETLVLRHRDTPLRAVRFARFRPDADACRAVLRQFDEVASDVVALDDGRVTAPLEVRRVDGSRSLFRSRQERVLYQAALRAFPGQVVIPNTALHVAVDYAAVSGLLTSEEREAFFRVLIDLAVFSPGNDYRPVLLIELDSPWHDDPNAAARDRLKERMIALAGVRLVRLRPAGDPDLDGMLRLIHEAL